MKTTILMGATAVIALSSASAYAQEEGAVLIDEVVVTANREASLLSKTPVAMTALSAEALRESGITDARYLSDFVPNVQITESQDAARISIRGVTSTDLTEKGDPSAAFLLDGVYIARAVEVLNSFYDLERVEVLRGPQGTLYGRNTTAGVINLISARPKAGEFEGSFDAVFGNFDKINATGMLNAPIGETLAVRVAVNYDRADSIIGQPSGGALSLDPYRDNLSGRLSFGGTLGDRLTFVLRGDYTTNRGATLNFVPLSNFFGPVTRGEDPVYLGGQRQRQLTLGTPIGFREDRHDDYRGIAGELTYDLDAIALTYLGSYRHTKRNDWANELYVLGVQTNSPSHYTGSFDQNSHELRAVFGRGAPLHGQVGLYHFHEKSFIELNLGNPLADAFFPGAIGFAFPQGPTEATSKAVFGQLTYDITSDLHVTGGLRYTDDQKSRFGHTVFDFPTVADGFCGELRCSIGDNTADRSWSKLTWKVGIDYDMPSLGLLYANVATGYKAGGFNDGCQEGTAPGCTASAEDFYFSPETLTAYEVGFKMRLADGAVRLNGALFHYDYEGLQMITVGGSPPSASVKNATSAKIDGIELEASFRPSENDSVQLAYNYLDARYGTFVPDETFPSAVWTDRALDHAPENTGSIAYTHSFRLANGSAIDASMRTQFSSEYYISDLNNLSFFRQPGYSKSGASLSYKANDDRWYVQGFVDNIENNITLAAATSGFLSRATPEQPRTYGVRSGVKF